MATCRVQTQTHTTHTDTDTYCIYIHRHILHTWTQTQTHTAHMDIDTLHIWTHTTHTDTGTHYTYGQTLHTWTQTYTTHMDTDGHRHTLHILRQQGDFISLPSVCKERKVSQICNYSRVSLIVINWNGQNHHKQWSPFQCKMFVCFKNL